MPELNEIGELKYQTRSVLPSVDWIGFFKAVEEAFDLHIKTYGPPGQKAPVYVADAPKTNEGNFDTSFDVITYKIMESIKSGTDPSGKRRLPKGPTLRERRPHPTKARYTLVTVGWWETMTARFNVLALSSERAAEITAWFHRMMMRYAFDLSFFKARGVEYMTFLRRGEDTFNRDYGQELYSRTLDYEVRLELLTTFEVKNLESLNVSAGTNPITEFTLEEQYPIPQP